MVERGEKGCVTSVEPPEAIEATWHRISPPIWVNELVGSRFRAVTKLIRIKALRPPLSLPGNNQFFDPRVTPLGLHSALLSISKVTHAQQRQRGWRST
jgi:hypothetical protein